MISRNLVPHLGKNNSNHDTQGEEIKKFDQASVKVFERSKKITKAYVGDLYITSIKCQGYEMCHLLLPL